MQGIMDSGIIAHSRSKEGLPSMEFRIVDIKKTLKKWEKAFETTHERKASSQDIRNAPQRIQDAYKEYNSIKKGLQHGDSTTACSTNSVSEGPEISGGTWGTHLNRSSCNIPKKGQTGSDTTGTMLHQYSNKLKMSASSLKPYKTPKYKKSESVLPKKSHLSSDDNAIQQGSTHRDEEQHHTDKGPVTFPGSIFNCLENKISMTHSTLKTKHDKIDGVPRLLHSNVHKKHHWTSEWLDSCKSDSRETHQLKTDAVQVNQVTQKIQETYRSSVVKDDVIMKHKPQSQTFTPLDGSHCTEPGKDLQLTHSTVMLAKQNPTNGMHADLFGNDTLEYKPGSDGNTSQKAKDSKRSINSTNNPAKDISTHAKYLHDDITVINEDTTSAAHLFNSIPLHQEDIQIAQNSTQNICTNEDNVERIRGHDSEEREELCCTHGHQGQQEDTSKTEDECVTKEGDLYEWPEEQPATNDAKQQRAELPKHLPSRKSASTVKKQNLNENFVKLELKKKRYTRKGLFHIKGEAYKRQVWKQMMHGRGGGLGLGNGGKRGAWRGRGRGRGGINMANPADKCFKCGQTGHWASTCYGPSQESEKKEVKEEDFPTLEEAALAARGIKTTAECDGTPSEEYIPEVSNEPVYDFPEPPPAIQPLFQPGTDGKPIEAPGSVFTALQQMGYKGFRQGQEQAIMRILSGLSTLVVLSTGAGKSLIYQLASVMYSQRAPCLTLVISPLVALMDDQVLGLPDCLKGVRLHSNMSKPQREKVVKDIQNGGVNILLVSPEAIVGGGGRGGGCMPSLDLLPPIAFACIDEVHCLSEWSHNFRPSYLMLCKVLRDRLGVRCLLGLTATATMATAQSVAQHLGINDQEAIIRGTCLPDNLLLSSSRDCNRERALVELLKSPRFCHLPSIIIYCIRREDTERVASLLRTGLPEDLLESNPSENKEEDSLMVKDVESYREAITVIREMDDKPISQVTHETSQRAHEHGENHNTQMNNDKEKQTYNNSNNVVSLTDDKNQSQPKNKTSRKSRKRKATDDSQESKTDGNRIALTGKKRRKQTSEADNVSTYIEEDDLNVKKEKAKSKKKNKNKKPAVKKRARITSKAALKGMSVITSANSVEAYHAGMPPGVRRRVQNQFMTGRLRIVTATVAFGMGLDKSDVRAVIHFNLPKSFESYVQEIGRAGRDQKEAQCHVFLEPQGKDLCELRRHTYANTVDRYCIKKLVRMLFPPCKCHQAHQLHKEAIGCAPSIVNQSSLATADGTNYEISDEQAITAMEAFETSLNPTESNQREDPLLTRLCKGHLVAIPIESSVQDLDIKEEGISTLLCYLELHAKHWLVNLPPTYAKCTIQCYGGPSQLQQLAKSCPPVAVAIAKNQSRGKSYRHASSVEFDVVEVARCMGWDLVIVKKELRQLKWRQVLGKGWVKSGVIVEFSDLAFLVQSPGDLTDEELDEVVNLLTSKSSLQERRQLYQLQAVYSALQSISHANYMDCNDVVDVECSNKLKMILKAYFARPLSSSLNREQDGDQQIQEDTSSKEHRVRGDVRQFISMHTDRSFSGRAVARVFHGISSPCYPAQVWGRDRRFWRGHLDFDFNRLLQIATEEILRLR
ncbi:ATP-dependent DNA helicase Q4-like isoform X2 [Asterias rubens]|uniref:ATP-dependent DNA helicase Q4-like isoform X2 n=1 Tax=Asterias rubens TaxID=7604 RepID=UPI001454F727|nr:ATP-dependent DNA helicase Q4-like isoform X2 [Asterias rubens]